MEFTFLKPLASLPKLLAKPALQKIERSQLVIHLLKGSGIDILKPDFDSIYAHALVEYSVDNQDKEAWISFFSLGETKEYIKTHLYKKPEAEMLNALDGLLHTGQGEVFLQLKRLNAQTAEAKQEYLSLKKHLEEYTLKSQSPQQAYQTTLAKEVLDEINKMREIEEQQALVLQNIDNNAQNILGFVENLSAGVKLNTEFLLRLAETISKMQLPATNQQTLIISINNIMDKTVEQFKEELNAILTDKQHLGISDILIKIDTNFVPEQYDRVKWVSLNSKSAVALELLAQNMVQETKSLINSIH